MTTLRVFVSSPSDVALEREITRKVLSELGHEYRQDLIFDPYFWEDEPFDFSKGYQPQIPKASDYHVVICMFFSRIGKSLTIDGTTYPSGTAYELLEAKAGKARREKAGEPPYPCILVFASQMEPLVSMKDADFDERRANWMELVKFLDEQTKQSGEFIGAINQYASVQDFESKLKSKLRSLIDQTFRAPDFLKPSTAKHPDWKNGNPYRGLFAFEFEHAPVFFGRSVATARVIQSFQNQVAEGRPRFVMLLGPSGSGKSSLARAGVLPTLVTPNVIDGIDHWRYAIMRPADPVVAKRSSVGSSPSSGTTSSTSQASEIDLFKVFAQALLSATGLPELATDGTTADSLAERLRDKPDAVVESIRGALRQASAAEQHRQTDMLKDRMLEFESRGYTDDARICRQKLDHGLPVPRSCLALLIDQFEELYTSNIPIAHVRSFTKCLCTLATTPDCPVFVTITLPSDFYVEVTDDESLANLLANRGSHFPIPVPSDTEMAQMIRLPALAAGLRFEEKDGVPLDQQLRSDATSNPDSLPLLEFCLEKLAAAAEKEGGVLTFDAYESIGRLSGVLAQTAEDTLQRLEREKKINSRKDLDLVLQSLIARDPNQAKVAVRRVAPLAEITTTADAKAIVNAFVNARLLVRYGSADATALSSIDLSGDNTGSPRFVAVAHEALLRNWEPARKWIGLDENQDFLRRRERLERSFQEWLSNNRESRYLLHRAIDLAEAQLLIDQHPQAFAKYGDYVHISVRKRLVKRSLVTGSIAMVVVAVAAFFMWSLQQQASVAMAGQLFAQADRSLAMKDFGTAEIASAKALTVLDSNETREQLLRSRSGGVQMLASSHQSATPIGLSVFSRSGDLSAEIRDQASSKGCSVTIRRTRGKTAFTTVKLDFLPESMAINQSDQKIRYLACARPGPAFTIQLWEIDLDNQQATLFRELDQPHAKRVPSMAFHPSRPWLAVGSEDRSLRLWKYDTNPPKLLWDRPKAHGTNIHGVAFNKDGSMLGTGGGDYAVKLWSIADPEQTLMSDSQEPRHTLNGHVDSVFCVAFSPDGTRLASGGYDRVIRIWNLPGPDEPDAKPQSINTLEGHEGTILDLSFSADRLLLSGSKDETVRLWHVNQSRILTTLRPRCGVIRSVGHHDGAEIFCGGESGWGIWSLNGRDEAAWLWKGGATVNVAVFDPTGEYLAAGGTDGNIHLWDSNHRLQRVLESGLEGEAINGIAFDPKGRWLVAGGEGYKLHVWDRQNDWKKLDKELAHAGPVWGLCFDPEGRWVASSNSDAEICIKKWNAETWDLEATFGQSSHSIYALASFIDRGKARIVSGDADAHVIVRDADTGDVLAETTNVTSGERNVWSLAICPEPLSIISGNSDGRVRRWIPETGQNPMATSVEDSHVNPTVNSVSFSKKHKLIAAGGDGHSIELYDEQMNRVFSLVGQDGTVWWVGFDQEGSRLAYGGTDGLVRFWNVDELQKTRKNSTPAQLFQKSQSATGLTLQNGKIVPVVSK
jgi:WD40 repeat protein